MSTTNCTSCGAEVSTAGRFCGSCGAPTQAPAVDVDPLGRRPKASAVSKPSTAPSTATLDELGVPLGPRAGVGRPTPRRGEMDWIEGAAIAVVALLPVLIFGLALGLFWIFIDESEGTIVGGIGMVSALAFGGGIASQGDVYFSAMASPLTAQAFDAVIPLTVTFISALLLFAGFRRALRHADAESPASCLRAVTPAVVVFVVGAVLLSTLLSGGGLPTLDEDVTVSTSYPRVFAVSALIAAVAGGIAIASRTRFSVPALERVWVRLSAPLFGVSVLLLLVGFVTLLGGTIAVVYTSWSEGDTLGQLGTFIAFALDVVLAGLSLGVLSSVDATLDETLVTFNDSSSNLPEWLQEDFSVLSASGSWLWLGIAVVLIVNVAGIVAAAAMILRRRNADAARQDFAVWLAVFLGLALLVTLLVSYSVDVVLEASSKTDGEEALAGSSVRVSGSILLLLPLFSAGWWFLARLLLPRIPAPTLTRLSSWARSGL